MNRLGEIFVKAGIITEKQLEAALAEKAKAPGTRLGEILVSMNFTTDKAVAMALSSQLRLPYVDLTTESIDPEVVKELDPKLATKLVVLPLERKGKTLFVAMADPLDFDAIQAVQFKANCMVSPVVASASQIREALSRFFQIDDDVEEIMAVLFHDADGKESSGGKAAPGQKHDPAGRKAKKGTKARPRSIAEISAVVDAELGVEDSLVAEIQTEADVEVSSPLEEIELKRQSESPPLVRLVNMVLQRAVRMNASDIHIEAEEQKVAVRYRIDGIMHRIMTLPKWLHGGLVSRIKIMSALDISERRVPQDGKVKIKLASAAYDVRVSTLPTKFGEKVVMRILNASNTLISLDEIGLSAEALRAILVLSELKQGLVLITGPTGSGKSTTLYAFIKELLRHNPNVITFEDPVEFQIPGVNQVQINEKANLTFANGLRSALRQDPDVIMVGEIRDKETLEIALQASITGHLVLSTIHTNDSTSTIARLKHLGAKGFQISAGLAGVVAQRLVRQISPKCRTEHEPPADVLERLRGKLGAKMPQVYYRGAGCDRCANSGYRGRLGIYEVFALDGSVQNLIATEATTAQLRERALELGMLTMASDCVEKVRLGLTTIEETERVFVLEDQASDRCPGCDRPTNPEFTICPYCSFVISHVCVTCHRELEAEWTVCPYCRTLVGGAPPRPGEANVGMPPPSGSGPHHALHPGLALPHGTIPPGVMPPISTSQPHGTGSIPTNLLPMPPPAHATGAFPQPMHAAHGSGTFTPPPPPAHATGAFPPAHATGAFPPATLAPPAAHTSGMFTLPPPPAHATGSFPPLMAQALPTPPAPTSSTGSFVLPPAQPSIEPSLAVLLVEADEMTAIGIQSSLARAGFQVEVTRDGFEGIARLQLQAPGLVMLDVNVMKSGGQELIHALRTADAEGFVPIMILSTKESVEEKLFGISLGVDDFLDKPFSTDELVERAQFVLRRAYA